MRITNWLVGIFVLLFLGSPKQANGQDEKSAKHTVSFLSGYMAYYTYEPILSSVRQSANLFTNGFAYQLKREDRYELGIKLLVASTGELTSRLSNAGFRAPNTGELFGGSLESYFRKSIKKGPKRLYLGAHLNAYYFDKSLDVIAFDDARAADLFLDLGPSVAIHRDFGRHQLEADLGLPLVGYVAAKTRNSETFPFDLIDRDKNVGTALRYGDFTFIDRYFNLNLQMAYSFAVTKKFSLGFDYGFQYYTYEKEEPFIVQAVSYQFLLNAKYEF